MGEPGDDETTAKRSPDTALTNEAPTRPSTPFSLPGYQLRSPLGRGGMGEVILAHDTSIGRDVAIKRISGDNPRDDDVERFVREARVQARLEHPAIVPVHQIGTDVQGRPFFTMKRLAGRTMHELLADPSTKQQRLLRAIVDVCRAIDLAHTRGVVHRDLKPANIMLGDYGEVYVLDWGIARVFGDSERPSQPVMTPVVGTTVVGATLGTFGYMAPEQIRDATSAGPPADVYALGCILFEVLAGQPAHPRGREATVTTLEEARLSPAERAPDRAIPPELDAVCIAALAGESAARPSVRELADRIETYLDGDRDLERRRALAAEHLRTATAAAADPARRAEAARHAGRALALDPDSEAAAALVTQLILEPPQALPIELARKLNDIDHKHSVQSARFGAITIAAVIATLPLAMIAGIASWTLFGVLAATLVGWLGYACYQVWSGRTNDLVTLLIAGALTILASRLVGSFLIIPSGIVLVIAALGQQGKMAAQRALLVVVGAAGFLIPLVLEQLGLLAPTTTVEHGHIVITSPMVRVESTAVLALLATLQTLLIVMAALFVTVLSAQRRSARRDLEIRAWHLQHMLPGRDGA